MDDFNREREYSESANHFSQDEPQCYVQPYNHGRPKRKGHNFAKAFTAFALTLAVIAGSMGVGIGIGSQMTNAYIAKDSAQAYSEMAEAEESIQSAEVKETLQALGAKLAEWSGRINPAAPVASVDSNNGSPSKTTYGDVFSKDSTVISDIYKAVSPSVVSINAKGNSVMMFNRVVESKQAGSGIIFKQDDEKIYIVTNYHVIDGANQATISLDDTVQVSASYVGGNQTNDIAIISVKKADMAAEKVTGYTVAEFADSNTIEIGNFVIAIGNALGEGKSATLGIISAINKEINIDNQILSVIQTDAAINPGNSGGALVNSNGKVIGINTAKLSSAGVEGMGYAIPSNVVNEIVDEIMGQERVDSPYMGIEAVTITEQIKAAYNFPKLGVYINSVLPDSSAAISGLRQGDIITAVNGKTITTYEELFKIIESSKVGDTLKITIIRNARMQYEVDVVLKNRGLSF